MMCSFGDYEQHFILKYLGGDIFINSYTQASAELISKLSVGPLILQLGLRRLFLMAFGIGTVGALLLCFGNNVTIAVFIAKFGFCQAWPTNFLSIPLLFPTSLNATSMSICNGFAIIMTVLSPIVAEIDPPIPMILLTISATVAMCLSQFLRDSYSE